MDDRIIRKLSDGTTVHRVYSRIAEQEVIVRDNHLYNLRDFPRMLKATDTGADFETLKALANLKREE